MDGSLRAARPAAASKAATTAEDGGSNRDDVAWCASCFERHAPTRGGTAHRSDRIGGGITGHVRHSGGGVGGAADWYVTTGALGGGSTGALGGDSTGAHRGHPAAAARDGHPTAVLLGTAATAACTAATAADTTEAAVERDDKVVRPSATAAFRCRPTDPRRSPPVDPPCGRNFPVTPRCISSTPNRCETTISHYHRQPRACRARSRRRWRSRGAPPPLDCCCWWAARRRHHCVCGRQSGGSSLAVPSRPAGRSGW